MQDWQLTQAEITTARETAGGLKTHIDHAIAGAATAKALRGVAVWLKAYLASRCNSTDPVFIIHEGRGYGEWLQDAIKDLEKKLAASAVDDLTVLKQLEGGETMMDDTTPTCDFCNDPLEQGKDGVTWLCLNPECQAKFEFQEGNMVLMLAPVSEQ